MQRVAIARSLMQHPKVLLADEPVASLDPESSAQILELLASLAREENMTVLCSLHQVELAKGWSDRIIGLRSGKVVLDAMSQAISMDTVMALYKNDDKEDLAKNVFSSHKLDQMV
jgi:phosphonate transport system ATP-binding protein